MEIGSVAFSLIFAAHGVFADCGSSKQESEQYESRQEKLVEQMPNEQTANEQMPERQYYEQTQAQESSYEKSGKAHEASAQAHEKSDEAYGEEGPSTHKEKAEPYSHAEDDGCQGEKIDLLSTQIQSLKNLKHYYVSKAKLFRKRSDNLRFYRDRKWRTEAKSLWRQANEFDKVVCRIEIEIIKLERQKLLIKESEETKAFEPSF